MMTSNPTPPKGPYPQPLLCGQEGKTPTSISIKTINRMVPKLMEVLPYAVVQI
jgi:hypothetical protein